MARLSGKKVVVIGGASGVGHAVGAAALAAGAEVVVGGDAGSSYCSAFCAPMSITVQWMCDSAVDV